MLPISEPGEEWTDEGYYGPGEGEGPIEGERDAWFEFRRVIDVSSVTACAFDGYEELLWTGSATVCYLLFANVLTRSGSDCFLSKSRHGAPYSPTGCAT